jgi:hypothetical protein
MTPSRSAFVSYTKVHEKDLTKDDLIGDAGGHTMRPIGI